MLVWLAGWPHSGSALCRMLIEQTLELPTNSVYLENDMTFLYGLRTKDFTDTWSLAKYKKCCVSDERVLLKTHHTPQDQNPAIFILRDGRNACVGLSRFWSQPVKDIIAGENIIFCDWSTHFKLWNPFERPNTLVVRFEDMLSQPDVEAGRIANALGVEVKNKFDNMEEECKKHWPQLFKPRHSDWRIDFEPADTDLFWQLHGETMIAAGYGSREEAER